MCKKQLIFGIGVNDYDGHVRINGKIIKSYDVWHSMIERCYSKKSHKKRPTYIGCKVHKEWLYFSNFIKWFDENYIEGYELDKDILFKGNKWYCTDTCAFVPKEINSLFTKHDSKRGNFPIGVSYKKEIKKFYSSVSINGVIKNLGFFNNDKEAFYAYKKEKEKNIKEMAEKYFKDRLITENIYNAMISYKVDIND